MKNKITRRKIIYMMSGVGSFIPFLNFKKKEDIKTEKENDFITHYCESGSTSYENRVLCFEKAKKLNKRVIFVFNYMDVHEVYPDGSAICRRIENVIS